MAIKTNKTRLFFAVAAFVSLALLLSGCAGQTKASYEAQMKKVLEKAKKDLTDVFPAAGASSGIDQDKKIVKVLKGIKKEVDKVIPHDEFFSGHSDITEFIDLSIKARTQEPKATQAKGGQAFQPPPGLVERNAARQALDRARRALPFLDYELSDAFRNIAQTLSIPNPNPNSNPNPNTINSRPPSSPSGAPSRPPQRITIPPTKESAQE